MKGSVLGLKVTKLSFVLITLVCTSFLLWGWDKAPSLVSIFPQSQYLQVSSGLFSANLQKFFVFFILHDSVFMWKPSICVVDVSGDLVHNLWIFI